MRPVPRRTALHLAGIGAIGTIAGCLSDQESDDERGNDGDETDLEVDVKGVGITTSPPLWTEDGDRTGYVTVYDAGNDLPWRVDPEASPDDSIQEENGDGNDDIENDDGTDRGDGIESDDGTARGDDDERDEELADWLADTDFDESVVLFVETAAPNACYQKVAIEDVTVESTSLANGSEEVDAIVANATAVDVSGTEESCPEVVSYPASYVRVTGDGLPSEARVTITDGWGNEGDVDSTMGLVDPDALPGAVEPVHDPLVVPPALECADDDVERLVAPDDEHVAWGETVDEDDAPVFAMRIENPNFDGDVDDEDALAFEHGDEVAISLWNVSDRRRLTGNPSKYSIEVLTDAGWEEVRVHDADSPVGYTDEGIFRKPGEGFDWSFSLTDGGLVEHHPQADVLSVCPALQPGRYRFRFWGLTGEESIAVGFDLVE